MIPLRDDQPRFSTPYLNYFLIGLNLLIYLLESTLDPRSQQNLLVQLGVVPAHVTGLLTGAHALNPIAVLSTIFTSMFLHASWLHVIGNVWFLWIFGDNVEDYLCHFNYLLFYLISGIAAALAQVILSPNSIVPTIGASGAIAGVLGAYFVLYPRARVLTWFFVFVIHIPAWVVLGYWVVLQFASGAVTSIAYAGNATGGIAFWAHVGGFIAGVIMIKIFRERPRRDRYGAF